MHITTESNQGGAAPSSLSARARFRLAAWLVTTLLALGCSALAQGFAGVYQGSSDAGQVTVELSLTGEDLIGRLSAPGVEFALEGYVQDGVGVGYAYTAEGTLGFEAYLEGATLGLYLFEMDANGAPIVESVIELLLERQAVAAPLAPPAPTQSPAPATANAPAVPAYPGTPSTAPRKQLGGAPAATANDQGTDQVLATGSHGTLTHDNAAAFIEALEFVLAQIGYAYTFTDADRAEALRAIAANYAAMPQMDQIAMAQARETWERVKVNWPTAAPADQREFALGVLILAFGEQTVSAWVGQNGGGGGQALAGGSSCTTFEDCTSSFVDGQTWSDTFEAQGCWAAAGCSGFDPSTNSFDYDTY